MGRGNRDKRSFQKSETIGWDRKQSLRNYSLDIERKRPTRDQAPPPKFPTTGPTETVRRGWNRTAGSRYQFAADGITFESSGGI